MTDDDAPCHSQRMLTREGIRWRGMRYVGPELAVLRAWLGPHAQIVIRIDPTDATDATDAHVLDEERGAWIRVRLASPAAPDIG